MATITSAQSGNFSDTATWVGGVVPGVSDDAVAANTHTVAIDVDVTVISVQQAGTGKFTLGNGRTLTGNVIANAGTFTSGGTVDVTATTTAIINGNVTGVSTTAANVSGVVITGTGALVLNGNVTGSTGSVSFVNRNAAVYSNVTCSITINGTVSTGTSGEQKYGLVTGTSSNANVTVTTAGNITSSVGNTNAISMGGSSGSLTVTAGSILGSTSGNFGHGIAIGGAITASINATNILAGNNSDAIIASGATNVLNVTATTVRGVSGMGSGGSGIYLWGSTGTVNLTASLVEGSLVSSGGYGVRVDSGSTANVTAPTVRGSTAGGAGIYGQGASSVVNVIGNLFGVGQAGHGVLSSATGANSGVVLTGDMTDSSLGATAIYGRIFRLVSTPSGITTYTNNVGYPTGGSVTRVSPDNVTGMPSASDVRKPLAYGFSNQLTGTMAVPVAGSVKFGVPVDNTTGTAELDLGRVAQIVGSQVAAGKSV